MPTSHFAVSPVRLSTDWDELFATYWQSWADPLQGLGELTFPHLGAATAAERASFERLKQNYLANALAHPERIHWIKCVDLRTGAIVGGGCYEVFFSNPYTAGKPIFRVDGFDENELKELSETVYDQMLDWRLRLTSNAHILGTALWILPMYRSQGVGRYIFDWMVAKWDILSLDAYMEGTVFSTPIALQYGFEAISQHVPTFGNDKNRSTKWHKLVADIRANPVTILWRPKEGNRHLERKKTSRL